jgi:hypothetical protein
MRLSVKDFFRIHNCPTLMGSDVKHKKFLHKSLFAHQHNLIIHAIATLLTRHFKSFSPISNNVHLYLFQQKLSFSQQFYNIHPTIKVLAHTYKHSPTNTHTPHTYIHTHTHMCDSGLMPNYINIFIAKKKKKL